MSNKFFLLIILFVGCRSDRKETTIKDSEPTEDSIPDDITDVDDIDEPVDEQPPVDTGVQTKEPSVEIEDNDNDGVSAEYDCDDNNDELGDIANDEDCDGIQTYFDCDDLNGDTECELQLDLGGNKKLEMVFIPTGYEPNQRYELTNDYYIMKTEVTQGTFEHVMNYDSRDGCGYSGCADYGEGDDFPAYYVSWHMAADFANHVTMIHNQEFGTNLQECYTCSNTGLWNVECVANSVPYQCTGYVLPTESEWEYAARSGTQYDFWSIYGGGVASSDWDCNINVLIQDGTNTSLLSDYSWFCGNQIFGTYINSAKPTATKLPNGFGLYDMHGNVSEWVADFGGCNFPQTTVDPYCSFGSSTNVIRGGNWFDTPTAIGINSRIENYPSFRYYGFGFRVVLHPPE